MDFGDRVIGEASTRHAQSIQDTIGIFKYSGQVKTHHSRRLLRFVPVCLRKFRIHVSQGVVQIHDANVGWGAEWLANVWQNLRRGNRVCG